MKLKSLLLASVVVLAAPAVASAQEVAVTANIGVTNDYVWRGVSQSDEDFAVQGGVDLTYGQFYAGAWASNVDFGSDADIEADLYAGIRHAVGPVTFDLGAIAYIYPGEADLDTIEYKAATVFDGAGDSTYTLSFFYSPDVASSGDYSTYTEAAGSWPLGISAGPFALGLGASAGFYNFEDSDGYWNYRLGLTGSADGGWGFNLGVSDTDLQANDLADTRASLLLTKTF